MPRPFEVLWEQLLSGGVGRRHARRYLDELKDHLDDLLDEERRTANEHSNAESRALARLGSVDTLAGAMIKRREFSAWSFRAPVTTYIVAPSLTLVAITALAMAAVVAICTWLKSVGGITSELPLWSKPAVTCVVFFSNAILAILLGWAFGGVAILQRSSPLFPIFGIVVVACLGSVLQVGVMLPSAGNHGEIEFLPGFGPSSSQWLGFVHHTASNLVLTLTPYLSLRWWRTIRADVSNQSA